MCCDVYVALFVVVSLLCVSALCLITLSCVWTFLGLITQKKYYCPRKPAHLSCSNTQVNVSILKRNFGVCLHRASCGAGCHSVHSCEVTKRSELYEYKQVNLHRFEPARSCKRSVGFWLPQSMSGGACRWLLAWIDWLALALCLKLKQ